MYYEQERSYFWWCYPEWVHYGVRDYCANEMRYNAEHELHGGEYRFAEGIVLASGYVERY